MRAEASELIYAGAFIAQHSIFPKVGEARPDAKDIDVIKDFAGIDENNPRKTNKKICISCRHCIVICPQKARSFGGLLYKIAGSSFVKANLARKEPEIFFV